ncbi:Alpha/Beta hydrolase protein [Truncatella angustata]|uniref:Alpha/Beta hydrolase protein n=1 Tax=Truncatella angustata TaxID=152316 RepID=A0A9P8UPP6_9PEZI|nr:Alpha/Beta hydrolase protein [Truncatella angustata]KAH6655789.1 Alpha/Beta hydrolase protein [Truncatella angustata]
MKTVFSLAGAASALLFGVAGDALAQSDPDPAGTIYDGPVPDSLYGSNFIYPWPVKQLNFYNQHQNLSMAFMDIPSTSSCGADNKIAVLLHGGNFCGVTWSETARNLSAAGFRVILPDDIGFCKSSKPQGYSYSVDQQAMNIKSLLTALNIINPVTVMGHSMGGMIAARYGLMYPDTVHQLILVDPLGLEDWVAKGVPFLSIDQTYESQVVQTFDTLKAYEKANYFYNATWEPSYDVWVQMLADIYASDYGSEYAYVMALVTDALLSQPVVYQLPLLKTRTYLMVGENDITALGKAWSSTAVAATLGHYDVIGPVAAAAIPNSTFHIFSGLGHAPFLQDPEAFHRVLFSWLD